jgi:hypothetical protein
MAEQRSPGTGEEAAPRIGPSGGPPDDAERQWRGSTPTEDVVERVMEEGAPERPPTIEPAGDADVEGRGRSEPS